MMNSEEHNQANREFDLLKHQYPMAFKKFCIMRETIHLMFKDEDE